MSLDILAGNTLQASSLSEVEAAIASGTQALLNAQRDDGHFVFELEADCTIPAEYILFRHQLADPPSADVEAKIGNYLRRKQADHGGWPLFHDGVLDVSCSVKVYFALKMIGDPIDAPHMKRAREAILAHGGAAQSNVFTRALLAQYGVVPWHAVPVMPVEIMLMPTWFPFHILKISYWARTVLVPLTILMSLHAKARNPRNVRIDELFLAPPETVRHWPQAKHQKFPWTVIFDWVDKGLRFVEPHFPKWSRQRAIDKAVAFVTERINGDDGLGAIWPAIVNSALMYDALGYPKDDPNFVAARAAIEKLVVAKDDEIYFQPCFSPVWDTALTLHALMEAGGHEVVKPINKAFGWLKPLQVLDLSGDWAAIRPQTRPGGWAFQYANAYYPDLDDTAAVVLAMDRARNSALAPQGVYDEAIARGLEWIEGMQSKNGGFGAFDADNTYYYLNYIPFADHGALLDPPTADVTARCVSMMAQLGQTRDANPKFARAVDYLLKEQEADGSWFGRWGVNYIYGTWSVLWALNAAGLHHPNPAFRKAVTWLKSIQNDDGGWGEDGSSYKLDYQGYEQAPSTASQTAWALLALMAAGDVNDPAVARGVRYLLAAQEGDGSWQEEHFTGTGFPRVFYLRYHGYAQFFPLWAVARFRNLKRANHHTVLAGL